MENPARYFSYSSGNPRVGDKMTGAKSIWAISPQDRLIASGKCSSANWLAHVALIGRYIAFAKLPFSTGAKDMLDRLLNGALWLTVMGMITASAGAAIILAYRGLFT